MAGSCFSEAHGLGRLSVKAAGDSMFAGGGTEQLHSAGRCSFWMPAGVPEAVGHKWVSTDRAALMATKAKMLSGAQGPAPLSHQGVPLPWQICLQR